MSILFETPVFNVESALEAAEAGVDRLELCSSFSEGGETPGVGMLAWVKSRVSIPVNVMIRPRGGNFVFTSEEIEVMGREMDQLRKAGADGFVFGILDRKNRIQKSACRELVNRAGNIPCTFHRAFDYCSDPEQSLADIIECGFKRVLTSGNRENMDEGLGNVIRLIERAGNLIIILPGGGLKPKHIPSLMETGLLKEVHSSCKKWDKEKEAPMFDPKIFIKFLRMMNR